MFRACIASLVLTACGGAVSQLAWTGAGVPLDLAVRKRESCLTAWGATEDADRLKRAVAATEEVIHGDIFKSRLVSISTVDENGGGPAITGQDLLRAFEVEVAPVIFEPDDSSKNQTAATDLWTPKDASPYATTVIALANVERWREGDDRDATASRACVVNTIAHEWTHAIQGSGGGQRFTDNGHSHSAHPLVSYTVGAVAQCAYLEKSNLLSPEEFGACVRAAGTRNFYGGDYAGKGCGVCRSSKWLDHLRPPDAPPEGPFCESSP